MLEKIYCVLVTALLMILSVFSSLKAQSAEDVYRTETFSTSGSPAVDISTSGGSVNVTGHDKNEVHIEMFVRRGRQYLSPSNTDLSDFDISIYQDGNRIIASAKRENSGWLGRLRSNNNISVSFRVYAPHASVVEGRTSGGSVSGENFTNQLKLRTSGGSVTAKNIEGIAELRTSGGSVSISDLHGQVEARTSGGSIRVENVTGEANLHTSGGSIRLNNISAKVSARTSGGGIRANLTELVNDVELRTSGGSIHIDMPEISNFNLDLTGQRVHTELRNFTGQSERRTVKGRMGEGGPLVMARTSGGSVRLSYY
ncbi:MAG: DUF4097 family beta strand repeat-containing protein [Balneolaceae bacterium]